MLTELQFSLVVPCYNEETALIDFLPELQKLQSQYSNLEVILVNNVSVDGTRNLLEHFTSNHANVILVDIPTNLGYGNGIIEGIKVSNSNTIIWTHSDMQCDINDVRTALILWESLGGSESLFIKGKRSNRGALDQAITLGLSIINYFINKVFISDINGQPNMLAKKNIMSLQKIPSDATFELFVLTALLSSNRIRIHTFPVNFSSRIGGVGANEKVISKLKYMLGCVKQSISIRGSMNDN